MPQLLGGLAPRSVWIEMSSATPAIARELVAAAGRRGIRVLDAPVGGDPAAAQQGRLLAYVGGSSQDLDEQRGVLEAVAERVLYMGPAGSGYLAKLLVNLLWFGQAIAGAEVLALAARAGLDPETMREAVGEGAGASRFMDRDAPKLLRGDAMASFSLARCHEELLGVLSAAEEHAVPMPLAAKVAELYHEAVDHYGDADGELLAGQLIAERAGIALDEERTCSADGDYGVNGAASDISGPWHKGS